jgi:predicted dehydrogenase
MAGFHIRAMLDMKRTTVITGLVEPSQDARKATEALFAEYKTPTPPFFSTVRDLLRAQGPSDAALICSPHKYHYENARECLKNGMDVCLEKPMVMNASEARRLIRLRDESRRLLVVAFPGSLSPAVQKAKVLIQKGAIGRVTAISAFAHQDWKNPTTGSWRQVPEISGGGFLFDTGSHMINTVVDLLDDDITQVSALLDNCGTPVEVNSTVSGRSRGGVMISLAGAGDSVQCCSMVSVFGDNGVIRTGIWGENLSLKKAGSSEYADVPHRGSRGPWEQFLKVRAGTMENPCPAEVGLRFAKLMDMIRKSSETGKTVKS